MIPNDILNFDSLGRIRTINIFSITYHVAYMVPPQILLFSLGETCTLWKNMYVFAIHAHFGHNFLTR